jgi:DNA-binding SARP family transcriptional activator
MSHRVRFEVLGPVRGWAGEAELELGSPQQRAVLAMLLLAQGRQVSVTSLTDGLWGDRVPRAAVGTIRTYISRLRGRLGRVAGGRSVELIQSVGDGYVLSPGQIYLDLTQFEDWLGEARAAWRNKETKRAAALLGDALFLWRGAALAGVPGPYAESRRVRLGELHMGATEQKLAVDIALGQCLAVIPELQAMLADHPFRERLSELLMVALYLSGRQADALAVFDEVRRRLGTELGIDPGPGLQRLHQRILRADNRLADAGARVGLPGELCLQAS